MSMRNYKRCFAYALTDVNMPLNSWTILLRLSLVTDMNISMWSFFLNKSCTCSRNSSQKFKSKRFTKRQAKLWMFTKYYLIIDDVCEYCRETQNACVLLFVFDN